MHFCSVPKCRPVGGWVHFIGHTGDEQFYSSALHLCHPFPNPHALTASLTTLTALSVDRDVNNGDIWSTLPDDTKADLLGQGTWRASEDRATW